MTGKRMVRFLTITALTALGSLIACTVWYGMTLLRQGKALAAAYIPYAVLYDIIMLSVICGAGTEIFLGKIMESADITPTETKTRYVLHYLFIVATVLICGYFFGWHSGHPIGMLMMWLTATAVYGMVHIISFLSGRKTAADMNNKLRELREKKK